LLRPGHRWWEWLIALVAIAGVIPVTSTSSCAQALALELRYLVRRRIHQVTITSTDDAMAVCARASCRVWCYDFEHYGRLDLNGRDVLVADRLTRLVESLSAANQNLHLAIHVGASPDAAVRTVMSLTHKGVAPGEWRRVSHGWVPVALREGRTILVERRHYLRTTQDVMRVMRVRSFSRGREDVALEALCGGVTWLSVSLHAAVLESARSRRITARAMHRLRSDAQVSWRAGFRWSVRQESEMESHRQREIDVAAGAALCHWALYLVVRASTLQELRRRVDTTVSIARAAGVQLDLGRAQQAQWFDWQLPGGPGW
jgi:hypothetical protein